MTPAPWAVVTSTDEPEDLGLLDLVYEVLQSGGVPIPQFYEIVAVAVEDGEVIGACVASQDSGLYTVVRDGDRRRGVGTSLTLMADELGGGYVVAGSAAGAALLDYLFSQYKLENIDWAGHRES